MFIFQHIRWNHGRPRPISLNYRSCLKLILLIMILVGILMMQNDRQRKYQSYVSSISADSWPNIESSSWSIPDWVLRYNITDLFDWDFRSKKQWKNCRQSFEQFRQLLSSEVPPVTVVNDVLLYLIHHREHGCVLNYKTRLPNPIPHPLPRARSWNETCSSLNIGQTWSLCQKSPVDLSSQLPATTHFLTVGLFNAFVDIGHCHTNVPGTVFTPWATYHFQRWTKKSCGNDGIHKIPSIDSKYRHTQLIDSIGNYLAAPGHFAPQQLPRLIRLLAISPPSAKVLVAKGLIADSFMDVLIERGVITRDRLIPYDDQIYPYHFANIVYRSESSPYLVNAEHDQFIHDRTDMQLLHRVISADPRVRNEKANRIILIKRKEKTSRSIIEHEELLKSIESLLKHSSIRSKFKIEVFDARGHIREHIRLFRQARVIIGPHGAGMMNIAWAVPGTHVVEIGYTTGMKFPQMYAEMSLHLDHHYWVCKGYGNYQGPIHVDMQDFLYIFGRIIQELEAESDS